MSHKILWLTLSLLCTLGLLGLSLVILADASPSQQEGILSSEDTIYTTTLPMVGKNYELPTIVIWHQWDPNIRPEYEAIVQEFNAAHPDLKIGLLYISDLWGSLSGAIPNRYGPDIIASANDPIGQWAVNGYLAPIDPWIDLSYMNDTYEPAAVNAMRWNQQIWGIPDFQEGLALVYNKALISSADIPAPDDFEALMAKAIEFRQTHPNQYYLCNQGLGNPDAYHVGAIYFGHGLNEYGGYIDEEGSVYMTTTVAISAAQWIADFRPYAPMETSHGICQEMLNNEETAIWWTGPWAISNIQNAGIDYGIVPMGSPYVGVRSYLLSTNAVERGKAEDAIEVMNYLGSLDVQKRLALNNNTIPTNTAALNDPDVQAIYEIAQFGASLHLGTPMGNHIYINCQWDPVGNATLAIWDGSMTPGEAMSAAQAQIEDCVAGMTP